MKTHTVTYVIYYITIIYLHNFPRIFPTATRSRIQSFPFPGHHKLSAFNCYLMTLMKLRLNLIHYDLAFRFNVSVPTVSRILSRWIFMMDNKMKDTLIKWPSREALQKTMPFCFRVHYGFELFIQKPSNLLAKSCTWSQNKHYNTAKYLISITPQGVISFVSKGWGGRVFDRHITENSSFLHNVLSGDVVLADREFNVADCLGAVRATLYIPAYTKGKDQLTAFEVEQTRNIANVRIHVERVIGCVRQRFTILSATGVLPKELCYKKDGIVMLDAIIRVCCTLNNMSEGIIPFE